jgi:hypothetical protein
MHVPIGRLQPNPAAKADQPDIHRSFAMQETGT